MTAIIVIVATGGLVMTLSMVLIQYFLAKLRREFNKHMQSQTGKYDCILAILVELSRIQDDSRILLASIEEHLRSMTENEPKERIFNQTDVERASV